MIRKKFYELEDSFWDEIFPSLLQANIDQKGNRLEARIAREIKNQQTKFTLLKSDKKTDYKSLYVMSESQDEEEKNNDFEMNEDFDGDLEDEP